MLFCFRLRWALVFILQQVACFEADRESPGAAIRHLMKAASTSAHPRYQRGFLLGLQGTAGMDTQFANGGPAAAPSLQERHAASDPADPGSASAGAAGADEQYVLRCAALPVTCCVYPCWQHRQGPSMAGVVFLRLILPGFGAGLCALFVAVAGLVSVTCRPPCLAAR